MTGSFQLGAWCVEPALNTISKNGTTTRLEPKVMEVLVCLAQQPGEPVSKEELLRKVWPDTFVSDDVLTRSISELRRGFGDDCKDCRFIQTIPKRGYRLLVPVTPVSGSKPAPPNELRERDPASAVGLWQRIRIPVVVGVVLAGAIAWLRASDFRGWLGAREDSTPIRLAVLPLRNLSGDSSQETFADAMTEELITELSRIRALDVISRTSVMPYKESKKPLSEIARELHADKVVEGSIMRSGNKVRVTAQLTSAAKDTNLWAQTYDRDVQDVLTLQSTVAMAIANEIKIRVTPEEQTRLETLRTVNPKALDYYVQARFHFDRADSFVYHFAKQEALLEEFRKGIASLETATQVDPTYLPAYVAYFQAVDPANVSRLEYLGTAKAALAKALELDETNVEAHLALARLLVQYEYDWMGGEKEYRRAVELAPNSGPAHADYSEYLFNVGRSEAAEKELDLAQSLDPSRDYLGDAGFHRVGNTIDQDRQALEERGPNDPFALAVMGKGYAIAGRYQESVEMWERCLEGYGWHDFVRVLKRAEARSGPRFALEEWMRTAEQYENVHHDMPLPPMAFTYASLGNKDRALAWLDRAVEQRNWMIIYLKRDNVWDPLRSDPRFNELLRRVGLSVQQQ